MGRYFIDGAKPDLYYLFDRRRGQGDYYDPDVFALAEIHDADIAQRICALLNADEQKRETAKQELVDQAQELNLGY